MQVSDIARWCICNYHIPFVKRLFSHLEISTTIKQGNILLFEDKLYPLLADKSSYVNQLIKLGFNYEDDNYITLYSRLYQAIYLSKHFYTFCCDSDYTKLDSTFNMIEQYHLKDKPQNDLKVMYQNMISYSHKFNTDNTDLFYTQHPCNLIPIIDTTTGEITQVNYSEFMYRDNILQNYFKEREIEFRKQIKHKELNELNYLMFN